MIPLSLPPKMVVPSLHEGTYSLRLGASLALQPARPAGLNVDVLDSARYAYRQVNVFGSVEVVEVRNGNNLPAGVALNASMQALGSANLVEDAPIGPLMTSGPLFAGARFSFPAVNINSFFPDSAGARFGVWCPNAIEDVTVRLRIATVIVASDVQSALPL